MVYRCQHKKYAVLFLKNLAANPPDIIFAVP
jgi:hypothetical protein